MIIGGIIIGLLILTALVVVHELGHAIAARRSGVVVEEFGIGFPPKAWGKKLKNGILFTINWLPIGGFVKLKGEHDSADKKGDYGKATFWQKTKILFAGVLMNWLVACLIFTILAFVGLPKIFNNQFSIPSDTTTVYSPVTISRVVDGSPASQAGLQADDEILSIQDVRIELASQISELTSSHRGKTVDIQFRRDGQDQTATAELRSNNDNGEGYLGVGTYQNASLRATWSAPIVGVGTTVQFTAETFKGLGQMFGNLFGGLIKQLSPNSDTRQSGQDSISSAGENVAGPIGIIGIIFPAAAQSGAITLLYLTAIISLSLAVMNILPIPALDGGRWFLMAFFRLRKKPLTKETEEKINFVGFVILLSLIFIVTIVDITKVFGS